MFKEPTNVIYFAIFGFIGAILLGLGFRWTALCFALLALGAVIYVNRPLK